MNIRHTPNGASTTSSPIAGESYDFSNPIFVALWQLTNMVWNTTTNQINYNHYNSGMCSMEHTTNLSILQPGTHFLKMQYATESPRWTMRIEIYNNANGDTILDRTFNLLVDNNGVEQIFYFKLNTATQIRYKFTFTTTNSADDIAVDNVSFLRLNDAAIDINKNTLLTAHNDNNIIYDCIGLVGIGNFPKVTSEVKIKYAKYGDTAYKELVFSELAPNPNHVFVFNLKQVAKTLLGAFYGNHIYKPIVDNGPGNYRTSEIIPMKDLYIDLRISITIKLTDNAGVQTYSNIQDIPFSFANSVSQLLRPNGTNLKEYSYQIDHGKLLLHPSGSKSTIQKVKIFKGYPMRVFKHLEIDKSLIILYQTPWIDEAIYYNFPSNGGINTHYIGGITLSDGINIHPKFSGTSTGTTNPPNFNELSFSFEVVDKCGLYFKWLNSKGGISYWLFWKHTVENFKTKDLGEVASNRFNLAASESESYYTDLILNLRDGITQDLGKESNSTITLFDSIDAEDLEVVREILDSPCVYMYMLPKGTDINDTETWQQDFSLAWLRVSIEPYSDNIYNSQKKKHNIKFKALLPKKTNQTL